MYLPILGTSCKWNYTISVLLSLAPFTKNDGVSKSIYQNFIPFYGWTIFSCTHITHSAYLFIVMDIWVLSTFQLWTWVCKYLSKSLYSETFSCAFWPPTYLQWTNIILRTLPILLNWLFCCWVVGYIDVHVTAFLCMWTSSFASNIYWKDYLCHTERSWHSCWKLIHYIPKGLFLSYFTGLNVCPCASIILF